MPGARGSTASERTGLQAAALLALAANVAPQLGCRPRSEVSTQDIASLQVVFSGCETVRRGALCERKSNESLTIWVPGAASTPRRAGTEAGAIPLGPADAVAGGTRYRVRPPQSARSLWVTEHGEGGARRWTLGLRPAKGHPALTRAESLRAQGRSDEAERQLGAALDSLSAHAQVIARSLLARIALSRGEVASAVRQLRQTMRRHREAGHLSRAVADGLALGFALILHQRDFVQARRVLADTRRIAESGYPGGLARLPYYEGLLASETGDVGAALHRYREAVEAADRLGLGRPGRHARQQLALTWASVGRLAEAARVQRQLLEGLDEEPVCDRADVLTNLVWIDWLAGEGSRPGAAGDVGGTAVEGAWLQRARQEQRACPDPLRRRNALINEALWANGRGDVSSARALAAELSRLRGGRRALLSLWEREVEAVLAMKSGRASHALVLLEQQRRLAASIDDAQGLYRAHKHRGQALEGLGRFADAVLAYQKAEQLLDGWLTGVPLGRGREAFLGQRDDNARLLVDLLVRQRRTEEAFTVARHARARLLRASAQAQRLRQLPDAQRQRWDQAVGRYRRLRAELETEARDDWALATDELVAVRGAREARIRSVRGALDEALAVIGATPAPSHPRRGPAGDLTLAYFPAPRGWYGFALWRGTVRVAEIESVDADTPSEQLSAGLIAPFAAQLQGARRLLLLPYGPLQTIDFHALPWRGAPLVAQLPVAYAVDAVEQASGDDARTMALVVADPDLDLPYARVEGDLAQEALVKRPTRVLRGRAVTRDAVMDALPNAWLFHYAGHGVFGGIDGADSALRLHARERLMLGDVLTLRQSPRFVILSACDTGMAVSGRHASGFDLARAFIAAGSVGVVAATRPLDDRGASHLTRPLYAALMGPGQLDMPAALRTAQLHAYRKTASVDWSNLRVFVP